MILLFPPHVHSAGARVISSHTVRLGQVRLKMGEMSWGEMSFREKYHRGENYHREKNKRRWRRAYLIFVIFYTGKIFGK